VLEQQRALPQVVEHQRRQHEEVPAAPDRPGAEVAHVGVQRLAAGHRQHHRAEDEDAVEMMGGEEVDRPPRVDRLQYLDRKSTRLNSSHVKISYAVFCLKKKKY